MLAMFAPLRPKAQELPHAASMSFAEMVEALNSHFDHEFFIEWGEFQREVAWDETPEIAVLPPLFYDSGPEIRGTLFVLMQTPCPSTSS